MSVELEQYRVTEYAMSTVERTPTLIPVRALGSIFAESHDDAEHKAARLYPGRTLDCCRTEYSDAALLDWLERYLLNDQWQDTVISWDHEDGFWLSRVRRGEVHGAMPMDTETRASRSLRAALTAAAKAVGEAVAVQKWKPTATAMLAALIDANVLVSLYRGPENDVWVKTKDGSITSKFLADSTSGTREHAVENAIDWAHGDLPENQRAKEA